MPIGPISGSAHILTALHPTTPSLPAGPSTTTPLPNTTPGPANRRHAGRERFQNIIRTKPAWKDEFASSADKTKDFKEVLEKSGRPIVHFPPSARGDMNAYKYTALLDEKDRPLTVFEYYDDPKPGSDGEAFNPNIKVIKEHLQSLGDRFEEGRDYIFVKQALVDGYKNSVSKERRKHYQQYDSIMSNPEVRQKAHDMFRKKIELEPRIRDYLAEKLPSANVTTENLRPESKLILVNINKRAHQDKWDPREYRHTTPDNAAMRGIIDQIYEAQEAIGGKDKLDLSFVGSNFDADERKNWVDYGKSKGVEVHFFNDMVANGLDRNQQRAAVFALTDQYKSTTYLGHQSGVNEDAQILQRTNVYSLSEYLSLGQIGISRVEARPQLDAVKGSALGMATGANSTGNFYSLRNSELLTTEGILAAVQIKLDDKGRNHRPLDELWTDLTTRHPGMTKPEATDRLFEMILTDAGKMKDGQIPDAIRGETETNYRNAVGVLVDRMYSDGSGLSHQAKQYLTNAMKQELTRHDSNDPVTRHREKLDSHNAGLLRYKLGSKEVKHRTPAENHDNYLEWLFPTK